jgi:tetratricopeptide (TPR) repeat protein
MPNSDDSKPGPGDAFFTRAEQVAETSNWDFAIKMYLDGLSRDPDNVERGHEPLRQVALKRKAMGGKGAGMMDKLKAKSKDPLEQMLRSEALLAKEPGAIEFMMLILKSAQALELSETTQWIAGVVLQAQKAVAKPSKRVLIEVANAFAALELYPRGLAACDLAKEVDPNDALINQLISEMSTKYTILKGKYGEKGDFTKGVLDMDKQMELVQQDSMVQDKRFLAGQIEKTRAEFLASPDVPGKVNAYVDSLLKVEDETNENQAIEALNQAYEASGAYQYKMRIDDIRIRQLTRKARLLKEAGQNDDARKQQRRILAFELEVYAERVVNYPTDLSLRYELGRRQYLAGKFDDAIGSLQRAKSDPRRRLRASSFLGMAFAKKGWLREAADTFEDALQGDVPELRTKDLLYNLGDVREKMGELDAAQEAFSRLAQIDYEYKDVRDRLDRVRDKLTGGDDSQDN